MDNRVFLRNMDSISSTVDTGSDVTFSDKEPRDRERQRGHYAQVEPVPEVSLHNSWSEEVEAHPPSETEGCRAPPPPPYDYVQNSYDHRHRRGTPRGGKPC